MSKASVDPSASCFGTACLLRTGVGAPDVFVGVDVVVVVSLGIVISVEAESALYFSHTDAVCVNVVFGIADLSEAVEVTFVLGVPNGADFSS